LNGFILKKNDFNLQTSSDLDLESRSLTVPLVDHWIMFFIKIRSVVLVNPIINRHTYRQTGGQTDIQRDRQRYRHIERHTDRQTQVKT